MKVASDIAGLGKQEIESIKQYKIFCHGITERRRYERKERLSGM